MIIDHFDALDATPSIRPPGATQRFASQLLEVFSDEWLPMAALHYRWNTPENAAFALDEFAANALPGVPLALGRRLIAPMANKMKSYLPVLGVDEVTRPAVEELVTVVLQALEAQLGESTYVLGERPCLGDFSLYGPLWAHLYRDPGSVQLFDAYPSVRRWMSTLERGATVEGEFFAGDRVPETLDRLFAALLRDQWGWIRTLVQAIDAYCAAHPEATRVPRSLGHADFSLMGRAGKRKLVTFVQYKAQRAEVRYREAKDAISPWIQRVLETEEVSRVIPEIKNPLSLVDFKAVLEGRRSP